MKKIIVATILTSIICLAGCNSAIAENRKNKAAATLSQSPVQVDGTSETASSSVETEETIEIAVAIETDPIPDSDRTIFHEQIGKLTTDSSLDTVIVYAVGVDDEEIFADTYLEATVQGETLTYELGRWEFRSFQFGGITLADLDGDGADEIVLIMGVTGNGGTLAQVFSAESGVLTMQYDLNDIPLNLNTVYKNGFLVTIENTSVNFSENIDISKMFAPECFDENGKYKGELSVYLDSVYSGSVENILSGNQPVIVCERTLYLSNGIGALTSVFRHNPATDTLEAVSLELTGRGDGSLVS